MYPVAASRGRVFAPSGAAPLASVIVSGAGTGAADGTYTERGTENDRPYYNLVGEPDSPLASAVSWNGELWGIWAANTTPYYTNDYEDVAFPWQSAGFTNGEGSGDLPNPTVTEG